MLACVKGGPGAASKDAELRVRESSLVSGGAGAAAGAEDTGLVASAGARALLQPRRRAALQQAATSRGDWKTMSHRHAWGKFS